MNADGTSIRCPNCGRVWSEAKTSERYGDYYESTRGQRAIYRRPIQSGSVIIFCSRCGQPIYPS